MANSNTEGLPDADALTGAEPIHIVQSGNSRDTTAGAIAALSSTKGQHTIGLPGGSFVPTETNGAELEAVEATNMIDGLLFDAATSEKAQISIIMPKSWDGGTIIAQFFWTHAATTTNFGVTWAIRSAAFGDGDVLSGALGTAVTVTDTGGTTNGQYTTAETSAMTVGGTPAGEDLVVFEVYRVVADGGDTMAIDAKLIGVKLHFTTDAETDS